MKKSQVIQPEIPGFRVVLHNFEGPFDALLQLISAQKMDVTDVALAKVTDEFVAYTRALGQSAPLDEITEFLVVAATLLDLKTARLLPREDGQADLDADLLETRDLLFARLLQYKAYKEVAELFATWQSAAPRQYPHVHRLEPQFAELMPPVRLGVNSGEFAQIAAAAFRRAPEQQVNISHVHVQQVSVPAQAQKLLQLVQIAGASQWNNFAILTEDCTEHIQIIGRFLALLELYKAHAVEVEQEEALGDLLIRWSGIAVDPAVITAAEWE